MRLVDLGSDKLNFTVFVKRIFVTGYNVSEFFLKKY